MAKKVKDFEGEQIRHDGQDVYGSDIVSVVKEVNLDKRILTMTGTTEAKDRDGDIISLKGWKLDNYLKNPVFLWSHDYRSVPLAAAQKVIRRRNPARMDFTLKFPTEGLYPFADMIFQLYGEKIINASSVGFLPYEWEPLEKDDGSEESSAVLRSGRRYLKQELLELSGCAVPSNPEALQNSVKGIVPELAAYLEAGKRVPEPDKKEDVLGEFEEIKSRGVDLEEESEVMVQVPDQIEPKKQVEGEEKAIGGSRSLPLDGGIPWDATAAEKRVRKWAGGDNIDWAKYRKAFVWYDSSNPEKLGSYKLLFADIFGGTLKAKWGGVMRAMGAVLGARGGVNIPESDRKAAYNFLSVYYKKFDKPVPSYHSFSDADVKFLQDLYLSGPEQEVKELKAQVEELEEYKAGAVLNRKNKDRLIKAQSLVQEVLDEAGAGQTESVSQAQEDGPQEKTLDQEDDLYDAILNPEQPTSGEAKKPAKYDLTGLVKELKTLVEKVSTL